MKLVVVGSDSLDTLQPPAPDSVHLSGCGFCKILLVVEKHLSAIPSMKLGTCTQS